MALKMGQVRDLKRDHETTWLGETVAFGYRVGRVTPAALELVDDTKNADGMIDYIVGTDDEPGLLVWWDIEGDDGQQLPVSREVTRDLPFSLLSSFLQAAATDAGPDPEA